MCGERRSGGSAFQTTGAAIEQLRPLWLVATALLLDCPVAFWSYRWPFSGQDHTAVVYP